MRRTGRRKGGDEDAFFRGRGVGFFGRSQRDKEEPERGDTKGESLPYAGEDFVNGTRTEGVGGFLKNLSPGVHFKLSQINGMKFGRIQSKGLEK